MAFPISPLPAPPIQTIPQGLLGLLQLKQFGRNPAALGDTVDPTVDLTLLWLNRITVDLTLAVTGLNGVVIGVPTAGANTYNVTGMNVPANQTWWVESFGVGCTLLAAETIRFGCGVFYPPNTGAHLLGPSPSDFNDVITSRARLARAEARGFWLLPGAQPLLVVYDSLTAGTINVTCSMRGAIIPI